MRPVENPASGGIERLERWHHGARRQHLDLQSVARKLPNTLSKELGVLPEHARRRPCGLDLERRPLRFDELGGEGEEKGEARSDASNVSDDHGTIRSSLRGYHRHLGCAAGGVSRRACASRGGGLGEGR